MITINNKNFYKNNSEYDKKLIDILFIDSNEPAMNLTGYYKVNKRTITLYDHNHDKIGCINQYGVLCRSTKIGNRWWHTLARIRNIGEDNRPYHESVYELHGIMRDCGVQRVSGAGF